MPVTISYDLKTDDANLRTYVRSMLERFHFRRLGGSVFRYEGTINEDDGTNYEDWLNHVVPALMFMRSFVLSRNVALKFFTIDAASTSFLDHSDPTTLLGNAPTDGAELPLINPSNVQSSEKAIRDFVDAAVQATAP